VSEKCQPYVEDHSHSHNHLIREDAASSSAPLRHPRGACGFHKVTPREAREVLRGKAILFVGNSVSRRLMYAVADAMGGKRARVNDLATDLKASAKYGVQRVWDSKVGLYKLSPVDP
jgi:hypothetical protein